MRTAYNVKVLTWLQLCAITIAILFAWFYVKPRRTVASYGVVDGILYSREKPSALVDGQVLTVGDQIYGVKIVEISKSMVVFENGNIRWQQRVRERPNPAWEQIESPD